MTPRKKRPVANLRIGIMPWALMHRRLLAIARGDLTVRRDDPKIWFSSIESLAQVLSTRNLMLLDLIRSTRPQSLQELADLSGRAKSNLSRTLRTLERYRLVELDRGERGRIRPRVPYARVELKLPLAA